MADKYEPFPLPPCPDLPEEPAPQPCPEWNICLPFGGQLYSRGGCVYAEFGQPPADGVYGGIVIANGCIVDVLPKEACLEDIAPCVSSPPPCDGVSAEAGAPSTAAGNLYELDAAGRPLVRVNMRGGDGISITGQGTTTDPFIIRANVEVAPIYITSKNNAISVSGSGTYADPFSIEHKPGLQTQVSGLTFDTFGHLIGKSIESVNGGITAVLGGIGIDVKTENLVATVSMQQPLRNRAGEYSIGGYKVSVDEYNRIFDIAREITVPDGRYTFGTYDVGLTDNGSISSIQEAATGLGASFIFYWPAKGTPSARIADFTLRFSTSLGGQFLRRPEKRIMVAPPTNPGDPPIEDDSIDFTKFNITIDDSPLIRDGDYFWSYSLFQPGQHRMRVEAPGGWTEKDHLLIKLFAISPPDQLLEEG